MFEKIIFYYFVLRGALSRWLRPHKRMRRSEAFVKNQYEPHYSGQTNTDFMFRKEKTFVDGRLVHWPVIDHKHFLLEQFAKKIGAFSPQSLLELGSGRGLNLLTLAVLIPSLKKIQGVELTAEGVLAARSNIAQPPLDLISSLSGLSSSEVSLRLKGRDITVVEGSIRKLPIADNSFDVVFSNSVIEQIPDDYLEVFGEASRVARLGGVFSEPFKEAQEGNIFKILYLKNIDYFHASYREITKACWGNANFDIPRVQKFFFNTGFLTVTKK